MTQTANGEDWCCLTTISSESREALSSSLLASSTVSAALEERLTAEEDVGCVDVDGSMDELVVDGFF